MTDGIIYVLTIALIWCDVVMYKFINNEKY